MKTHLNMHYLISDLVRVIQDDTLKVKKLEIRRKNTIKGIGLKSSWLKYSWFNHFSNYLKLNDILSFKFGMGIKKK